LLSFRLTIILAHNISICSNTKPSHTHTASAHLFCHVCVCRQFDLVVVFVLRSQQPAVQLVILFSPPKFEEPIHWLPQRTLWISTCFLCTSSSKWHLSTPLVARLLIVDPCVSTMQRSSVSTQQSAKCLVVCCLSKCCRHLHKLKTHIENHHC